MRVDIDTAVKTFYAWFPGEGWSIDKSDGKSYVIGDERGNSVAVDIPEDLLRKMCGMEAE